MNFFHMNNEYEIVKFNQYNFPEGARTTTCPICSSTRKKKYEKCMSLDWNRGLGTCHHCGKTIQLHLWKRVNNTSISNYYPQIKATSNYEFQILPKEYIPTNEYIDKSNLFKFLLTKFREEDVRKVFSLYYVGTSKHWINDDGYSTKFPQMDINGKLRQLKVIAYNPITGKRLHKEDSAQLFSNGKYITDIFQQKVWFAGKSLLNNPNPSFKQCFFGEHILSKSSLPVAVVESEKTAIVCALSFFQYTWIATGGKNGCRWTNEEVFSVLKNKKVILFPDLDCYEEWKEKAKDLKDAGIDISINISIQSITEKENLTGNWDIADLILAGKI